MLLVGFLPGILYKVISKLLLEGNDLVLKMWQKEKRVKCEDDEDDGIEVIMYSETCTETCTPTPRFHRKMAR